MSAFYGALFVVYGMHVPYTPVWLHWRGLTAAEISAVMAAPFFLRIFVTPAVAVLADRHGSHRTFLICLGWMGLAAALVLSQVPPFWPVLILSVVLIVTNSTIMPLTETVAVAGVRRSGIDYGRMRLWGSLTFVVASFAGGFVVDRFGGGAGIWLVALGCGLTALAAHGIPKAIVEPSQVRRQERLHGSELKALLLSPAFVTFLCAAGFAQAAHATFLAFGTLIWQAQGLSGAWIGALWAIGVIAEVALFWKSGSIIGRTGPVNLLVVAAAVSCLRWLVMGFSPGLWLLVPLSLLHGITYGASHVGAIHFIHRSVPPHMQGGAQALYSTMAAGLAMGVATLIAGKIYAQSGGHAYLAMSAIAVLSLIAALRLKQLGPGLGPRGSAEQRSEADITSDDRDVLLPEPLEAQV
jgi:PPP family 3-phenylpropionic acid transporter